MPELYLRLLDRLMTPILLILALFLLLRGHNLPGGGFIAGLMAAAAFELQILGRGVDEVQESLGRFLQPLMGLGLLVAVSSALAGIFRGVFFKGLWGDILPGGLEYVLGSPVIFDVGVFCVVVSVATSYLLGLNQAAAQDRLGDTAAQPAQPNEDAQP